MIKQKFDVVYCLGSTWCFTDVIVEVDFMGYFVQPGGWINFDIMNKDQKFNKAMLARANCLLLKTMVKSVIKFVANLIMPGRYIIDTLFGAREVMYYPNEIEAILLDRELAYEKFTLRQIEARGGRGGCPFPVARS